MARLEDIWAWIKSHGGEGGWILQVFVVVFLALLLNLILRRVLDRVQKKLEKTATPWDDALIEAVRRPLSLLVWILGLTFAADIILKETGTTLFGVAAPLRDVGVIIAITWFLLRFIRYSERNIIAAHEAKEKEYDTTTVDAVTKLLRVSVLITSVLVILQTLGISVSGVMAFGGIGGIAVGFAARDLLANFFGGLMIYLDRPFSVGDWVRSPDRNIEGTVENIGWRLTRIRTFDKRPLYVPNSVFANIAVENPSRMSNRRIYETIGVRYDDASRVSTIVEKVKQMLKEHPEIDKDNTLIVNFNKFAQSSLDFFVYTFTHTTEWVRYHEVKQDILLKILDIIESEGAECAFPTSTLHVPDPVVLQQADSGNGAK